MPAMLPHKQLLTFVRLPAGRQVPGTAPTEAFFVAIKQHVVCCKI